MRALGVNEKKIICTFRNMILVKTILRKVIPRNDDLPKVIVTKIKFNKSLQSHRTESEIKTSFNFTIYFQICNLIHHPPPPSLQLSTEV